MNISTGGLHILLFERDQQLATLLMSELQLAGYEGHTARTAVEVFDAIARYPVRLVLVNLAQAAAARREFWVALDTQRRGSNIQVLTFHCTNLAGYGPRDAEEHPVTIADLEIDGMLGIVRLLDIVRARVPNADINANTVPRLNRTGSSSISAMTARLTQPVPVPNNISTNKNVGGNSTTSRNTLHDEGNGQLSASRVAAASLPHTPPSVAPTPSIQSTEAIPLSQVHYMSQVPPSPSSSPASTTAHPEKIRAVIYPSQQRNWGAPAETSRPQDPTTYVPYASQASTHSVSDTPVLQRLANGGESGLAQLTRLVQESQVPSNVSPVRNEDTYVLPTYTPLTARVGNAGEAISSQPLRPAPIQDLPEERPVTTSALSTDGQRRTEALSRPNYNPQPSVQVAPSATQSPLASIATSGMAASSSPTTTKKEVVEDANRLTISKDLPNGKDDLATFFQMAAQTKAAPIGVEQGSEARPTQEYTVSSSSESKQEIHEEQDEVQKDDEEAYSQNSVILDILQSLPPMPALGQQQAVQAQVLNGRVTRSLGSVLLDGHLVPQERLEVAQNIQRMLRGVDLNYQLGEILLMFKLLTPDQLLAASLVSYGLITTTQISAFGRIRQELHSIGLEYDLENLLILFRILTPEQLREARSNIQN